METPANNLLLGLLAYAAQRDISPERLCQLAEIDPQWLTSSERPTLSEKQVEDLWVTLLHLSNDQQFGLHFGESLGLSALGIVGEIIKSSGTVGEAVTIAAGMVEHVTRWFTMTVSRNNERFTIHINPSNPQWRSSVTAVQMLDVLMVLVIHELDGLLLQKTSPVAVDYVPEIINHHEYQRVFRCQPATQRKENTIAFDLRFWNEQIITANYELQHFLKERITTSLSQTKPAERLSDKINRYLVSNAYLGVLSLEDTAANFNISPRTLQRRLKQENFSFQELADNARQDLSVQALKSGGYPVKEIAYMLGYNELSAFSRAFKRWTGVSPYNYRVKGPVHSGARGKSDPPFRSKVATEWIAE